MYTMKYIFTRIVIISLFTATKCDIDPFAMDINTSIDRKTECPNENSMAVIFYKRSVNMVLNLLKMDGDQSTYNGQIYLTISAEDFNFLKAFAAKDEDDNIDLFHKADSILSRVYAKSTMTTILERFQFWFDNIYMNFCNRRSMIFVAFLIIVFLSYKLLRAKLTLLSTIKHLLFMAWIVDFIFIWLHLLQTAEINKISDMIKYKNIPVQCDPSKMSYWEQFLYSLSATDECKEYYNMLMKEEFWSVSPFIVLSEQFKILIKTPIITIGHALSEMLALMMTSFPWYTNFIFAPMLLICFLFFACILLSFATNTPFGISVFHIINIHFGNKNQGNKQIVGENRPMIEELPNVSSRGIVNKKKKSEKRIIVQPDSESEDVVNEEIKVCILRKRNPKNKENIVDSISDIKAIDCEHTKPIEESVSESNLTES